MRMRRRLGCATDCRSASALSPDSPSDWRLCDCFFAHSVMMARLLLQDYDRPKQNSPARRSCSAKGPKLRESGTLDIACLSGTVHFDPGREGKSLCGTGPKRSQRFPAMSTNTAACP